METNRPALIAPRTENPFAGDVAVRQPTGGALIAPRTENPFAGDVAVRQPTGGAVIAIEQQRAIAEVQARMIIARSNPRNPIRAMEQILNDCTRPGLAEKAVYEYARGGTGISGPSIRLAEAIAQKWGNIASGIKELARHDGYSECVAYAWDLETGYYDERQFQIRHWRDTKRGGYALDDERDIYELVANFGQRRKRAVLLTVIPGDVVEAALEQCERTMQAGTQVTPEGIQKLIEAFAALGVQTPQIEARIQRRLDAIRPAQVIQLRKIYTSISDGMSEIADWFEPLGQPTPEAATAEPSPEPQQRPRGRPRGSRNAPPQQEEQVTAPPPPDEAPGPVEEEGYPGSLATPRQPEPEPPAPPPRRGGITFEA